MFGITYTFKVAFLPFPAVFITAFSAVPAMFIKDVEKDVITSLADIIDKAQLTYKAVIIANEPTAHTHNLDVGAVKNAIVACCSLRFQSSSDMNAFIQKEIQKQ